MCRSIIKKENYTRCYGGLIIFLLIIMQIICIIFYFTKSLNHINKYIFGIINNYVKFLKPEENISDKRSLRNKPQTINFSNLKKINNPPKANGNKENQDNKINNDKNGIRILKRRNKSINRNINVYFNNDKANSISNEKSSQLEKYNNKLIINKNSTKSKNNLIEDNPASNKGNLFKQNPQNTDSLYNFNINNDGLINNIGMDIVLDFEEYLETELE